VTVSYDSITGKSSGGIDVSDAQSKSSDAFANNTITDNGGCGLATNAVLLEQMTACR